MSTKIYDGMKFDASTGKCFDALVAATPTINTAIRSYIIDSFSEKVAVKLDVIAHKHGKTDCITEDIITNTLRGVRKEFRDNDEDYATQPDTVLLMPYNNKTYAYPYISGNYLSYASYKTIFKEIGFIEYSYWDNADRPDDVTTRQWTAREKLWGDLLNKGDGASFAGISLQYEFMTTKRVGTLLRMISPNDILDHLPGYDIRIHNVANALASDYVNSAEAGTGNWHNLRQLIMKLKGDGIVLSNLGKGY